MRGPLFAVGIIGILMLLSGTIFAFQGVGWIGGSVMSGNTFWIYAGSAIAVIGLIIAVLGFWLSSRSGKTLASSVVRPIESSPSKASE